MDNRDWHSDPLFRPSEESENDLGRENCLVDLSCDSPRSGIDQTTPPTAILSPKKRSSTTVTGASTPSRLNGASRSSVSSTSLTARDMHLKSSPGRRDLTNSGRRRTVYSMKEIDEHIDKLQKENFRLKVQIEVMERRMEVDENSLIIHDDGEKCMCNSLRAKNIENEVTIEELRRDVVALQDENERSRASAEKEADLVLTEKLEAAFQSGYSKACSERNDLLTGSGDHSNEMDEEARLDELKTARIQGYNDAMREFNAVNANNRTVKSPSAEKVCQTTFAEADRVEEARQAGYLEAVEHLKLNGTDLTKPILVDNGTDPEISIKQKADESLLETTEYADFPPNRRLGSSSAMSPFKRTRLAGGDSTVMNRSAVSSPVVTGSGRKTITPLERTTFNMLIGQLQSLVEFMTRGLRDSFNYSDASLNATNVSILEMTMANVSLIPDIGSGDGSHVSFCLATKLQEIIDISHELSLHDVEVETDQQWAALQDENRKLAAQIEILQASLQDSTKTAEENGKLSAQILAIEEKFVLQVEQLNAEIMKLNADLQASGDLKKDYQEEVAGLADHISSLEKEMTENQAQCRFLMENAARRPTCHIETSTEISMEDLDKEIVESRSESRKLSERVLELSGQLESMNDVKSNLESRLDELNNLMCDLEAVVKEKEELSSRLESVQSQLGNMEQEASKNHAEMLKLQSELEDVKAKRETVENHLVEARRMSVLEIDSRDHEIQRLHTDLKKVSELQKPLKETLQSSMAQLEQMQARICELERYVDRPQKTSSQQTEYTWPDLKAEKAQFVETIEKLVVNVEALENELDLARSTNLGELDVRDNQLRTLENKIRDLTDHLENVLDEKDVVEQRIADMEAVLEDMETKLAVSDHRRRELEADLENMQRRDVRADKLERWEQAVKKEVGKTNRVIKEATKNLSRARAAETSSQHPLTERAPTQSKTRDY